MVLSQIVSRAAFTPEKMGKVSLAQGDHLFAGLNCFLPGQEHKAHTHADQDKIYVVLEGAGEAMVSGTTYAVSAGDLVFAPAGSSHSLRNTGASNLAVLVILAPPPSK